jgi:aspartate racemase
VIGGKGRGSKKVVGILGGMGPAATLQLLSRVIALTPADDDADHVPLLIDHNPQVPSRIEALIEKRGADPAPVLAAMARRLSAMGASALAMPCNTAHVYASTIQAAAGLPFLNMIELTARRLATMEPACHRIGVLASPAIRMVGIYDKAFSALGLTAVYPEKHDELLEAIRRLKRDARDPGAREIHRRAAEELQRTGVEALVIACTEFSLIADAVPSGARVTDALDVLAESVVAFACGNGAVTGHPVDVNEAT